MIDRQGKNVDWDALDEKGNAPSWERAGIAVLMDIRREMRALNGLLACENFLSIPHSLVKIEKNTRKRKRGK